MIYIIYIAAVKTIYYNMDMHMYVEGYEGYEGYEACVFVVRISY